MAKQLQRREAENLLMPEEKRDRREKGGGKERGPGGDKAS